MEFYRYNDWNDFLEKTGMKQDEALEYLKKEIEKRKR
jgi:hypothetical protein